MNKVTQAPISFWVMQVCAATLRETAGALSSMTIDVGYTPSSLLLWNLFLETLALQLLNAELWCSTSDADQMILSVTRDKESSYSK